MIGNQFRARLDQRQFALVLEIVPPKPGDRRAEDGILSFLDSMANLDIVATVAVGDRIRSDDDQDAVTFARCVADRLRRQPLVHVAGKDRRATDIIGIIAHMREAGLQNALLMTGDRIKNRRRERRWPVRYFDSVNMIELFAEMAPDYLIGAVVNPFKHVHEDLANQMLKLEKKLRAGAAFIVAQIGFAWRAYQHLRRDCMRIAPSTPLLANVAYLSPGFARLLHDGRVPGIILPTSLLNRIEAEHQDETTKSIYAKRVAIQILTLKAFGYAGVHVSAVHTPKTVQALLDALTILQTEHLSLEELLRLWEEYLPSREAVAQPSSSKFTLPSQVQTIRREHLRYRILEFLDRLLFADGSLAAKATKVLVRWLAASPGGNRLLGGLERAIKKPLVGCQMCGFCRLPHTMYVCPETCPKGLANGPCGGTTDGLCEFGDRPCIHNQKYRMAALSGRARELAEIIIPPVPDGLRGSSSWVTHFRDGDPPVRAIATPQIRTPKQRE